MFIALGTSVMTVIRMRSAIAACAALGVLAAAPAPAQNFRFSQPDTEEADAEAARQDRIAQQLSTPCRAAIKDKKIVVIIGER